jgi:mono/diheme cytochrome c family protein
VGGESAVIAVLVLGVLVATAGASPEPVMSTANRWAEPTRGILAQHCGRCHLPNLPTSAPRALKVFDLSEEPWYARLTNDQFDDLLRRVRAIKQLPEPDVAIVESFVRCARDQLCPQSGP